MNTTHLIIVFAASILASIVGSVIGGASLVTIPSTYPQVCLTPKDFACLPVGRGALHLDIFEQPGNNQFSRKLLGDEDSLSAATIESATAGTEISGKGQP